MSHNNVNKSLSLLKITQFMCLEAGSPFSKPYCIILHIKVGIDEYIHIFLSLLLSPVNKPNVYGEKMFLNA